MIVYDGLIISKMLENSKYSDKMKEAIWGVLAFGIKKADAARRIGVSRQHVTRTVNDFVKKYEKYCI